MNKLAAVAIIVASLPTSAMAAAFCLSVPGSAPQCIYADGTECARQAGRQNGHSIWSGSCALPFCADFRVCNRFSAAFDLDPDGRLRLLPPPQGRNEHQNGPDSVPHAHSLSAQALIAIESTEERIDQRIQSWRPAVIWSKVSGLATAAPAAADVSSTCGTARTHFYTSQS